MLVLLACPALAQAPLSVTTGPNAPLSGSL
jgi:hypothetical protein